MEQRSFKKLFWPTFIELLFFMLMGTIDTLMLSNFSDYAVGSVGNANTLIQLFIANKYGYITTKKFL